MPKAGQNQIIVSPCTDLHAMRSTLITLIVTVHLLIGCAPANHEGTPSIEEQPLALFYASFTTQLYERPAASDQELLFQFELHDMERIITRELEARLWRRTIVRARPATDQPAVRYLIEKDSAFYEVDFEVTEPFVFAVTRFRALELEEYPISTKQAEACVTAGKAHHDGIQFDIWEQVDPSCLSFQLVAIFRPDSTFRDPMDRFSNALSIARINEADGIVVGTADRPPSLGKYGYREGLLAGNVALIRYTPSPINESAVSPLQTPWRSD